MDRVLNSLDEMTPAAAMHKWGIESKDQCRVLLEGLVDLGYLVWVVPLGVDEDLWIRISDFPVGAKDPEGMKKYIRLAFADPLPDVDFYGHASASLAHESSVGVGSLSIQFNPA